MPSRGDSDFGVTIPARRRAVRYCVDWSERRHHLAGAAGCGLANRLFGLGWLRRSTSTRAVHITGDGQTGLAGTFGVHIATRP